MTGTADAQHVAERAAFIRRETNRLISSAKTGYYASTFSAAELLATLYYSTMRLRPGVPDWPGRDRFLLGKGHAALGVYPALADLGYFLPANLEGYTRLGSPHRDHPDMRRGPGIDFSSGSLGHALSAGVGMRLGARSLEEHFDVFVLLGDGTLHKGQVWEAALAAGHHGLGNLVAIVDRNGFSLDGQVDQIVGFESQRDKWAAFGWESFEVEGHGVPALLELLGGLRRADRAAPALVVGHTVKGKPSRSWSPRWAGTSAGCIGKTNRPRWPRSGPATIGGYRRDGRPATALRVLEPPVVAPDLSRAIGPRRHLGRPRQRRASSRRRIGRSQVLQRLVRFEERHPGRSVQFGISEQHMLTAASGMSTLGLVPYVATFACFLALWYWEQIRSDIAYPRRPVRLIGHHAEHRRNGGRRPTDATSLAAVVCATATLDGPLYIRIGRGREPTAYDAGLVDFEISRGIVHAEGEDLTLVATGSMVAPSLGAARVLAARGRSIGVLDMHTVKPLDDMALLRAESVSSRLITVEEHNVIGGVGSAVAETLEGVGVSMPSYRHGVPDDFSLIGPPTHLYHHRGLNTEGIAKRAEAAIEDRVAPEGVPGAVVAHRHRAVAPSIGRGEKA